MVKHLLLLPAVLLLVLHASAQQQKPAHKPASSEAAPAPATIQVEAPRPEIKKLFSFDCAICHGATGNGKSDLAASMNLSLLDWTSPTSLAGKTDDDLFKVIRNGKDKMPPEDASRARDEEIRGLVKYIRNLSKGQPAPAPGAAPAEAPATASASPSAN